ncbi:MAG: ECF transporter S component [Muribaculaceae bacterium]|nr:ECF transporter S component [Muribaculaceae bacterium]MBQ7205682.1 ECF transporter S component [Muribaculaceae bacterium]
MESNATAVKLYSLGWRETRTYMFAVLFIVGNIVLPQLCHLFPQGGLIMLPIYFFTLIAAYKFGLRVGLLTAVLSPLINSMLFGMPPAAALPIITIKGVLLAMAAAWMAGKSKGASLLALIGVVLAYQLVGGLIEWAITGSLASALQDWKLGYPGMILQAVGGWLVLNLLLRR